MMGDDMAIRSGGVYGRPESQYTLANPVSASSSMGTVGNFMKYGFNMASTITDYRYKQKQANLDLQALQAERAYNVANFKQKMADTLAQNKMSFYASGLDYKAGSAQDVIKSNQAALGSDLAMMEYNYDIQERNIKNNLTAARRKHIGNVVGSTISYATSLVF